MLTALSRVCDLFFAGQTSTHRAHPVQSSGATWIVYFKPCQSRSLASHALNAGGAVSNAFDSYALMRMTACGHTIAHLPHWMHVTGSQAGISVAMLRFSNCAVPVGNVPSQGRALTGRLSPQPAMMGPRTSRTNGGAAGLVEFHVVQTSV